jgi:hypothetical protein
MTVFGTDKYFEDVKCKNTNSTEYYVEPEIGAIDYAPYRLDERAFEY